MAGANLNVTIAAKDELSHVLSGMTKPIGGLVSSLGALGLAGLGIDTISTAFHGFVDSALEAQNIQAGLNAVLKSTRGISGMTAESVNALATSFSRMTPFEDEAIGGAENLLLTFTNIGKDVFPDTTEAVLNMSQALGQDLKSSAIQLGKALNDPIKGITALSRVGVTFSDDQKDLIQDAMDSNDILKAQKIILGELSTEFGGAAKAAGETFAGKMSILNTQIGNVKEAIGGPLLGVLGDLLTKLNPVISAIADGLPGAIDSVISTIEDFVPKILNFGQGVIAAVTGLVHGGDIEQALADLNDIFVDTFDISPGEIVAKLAGLGQGILDWIIEADLKIVAQLLTWAQAFIAWIGPATVKFLGEWPGMLNQFLDWIEVSAGPLLLELGKWAIQFIAWIVPMIPGFLVALGQIALAITVFIVETVIVIGERLLKWGMAFIDWVIPQIPGLLANLGQLAQAILQWIAEQVKILVPRMLDLGRQLGQGLLDGLRSIQLPSLASIVGLGGTPSSGAAAGANSTNNIVNVNINGNPSDPASIHSAANSGVLAAQRSMGY